LVTNGTGTLSWATASASPGGSSTQLQYNNAGAFGGISGVTSDGTRITASTTIGVGGATPSTSGSGITFPATQSASTDANTLDDYEEGTWTPSLGGNTTYTAQNGNYTKIGRMVFFRGVIVVNTIGTGSATTVSGLPFSAGTGGAFVDYWSALNTNVVFLSGDPSGTTVVFYSATAAAAALSGNSIFKNGTQVNFTGLYQV
jgi:hypothetical protein